MHTSGHWRRSFTVVTHFRYKYAGIREGRNGLSLYPYIAFLVRSRALYLYLLHSHHKQRPCQWLTKVSNSRTFNHVPYSEGVSTKLLVSVLLLEVLSPFSFRGYKFFQEILIVLQGLWGTMTSAIDHIREFVVN